MDNTKISVGKLHPFERANIFSKIFFCWLLPFFYRGTKTELDEDKLYQTRSLHGSTYLRSRLEKEWKLQLKKNPNNPSLLWALFRMYKFDLMICVIFDVSLETNRIFQPLLVSKFLSCFEDVNTDRNDAYVYASLLMLSIFFQVLVLHSLALYFQSLGMKLRVSVCALIYKKALKLNNEAFAETTVGQMVNLLSNDVSRFDTTVVYLNTLWLAPLELTIVTVLLYQYVGVTGLVGTGFLLLFIPLQGLMAKKTSYYRLRTALRTDERIRLMNEIIKGIQVIKMYTWELPFAKLVQNIRKKELKVIKAISTIRSMVMSFNLILNRTAIYLCILTYIMTNNHLTATYVFTITSFYDALKTAVTTYFPIAVTQFAESLISVERIRKFLLFEEVSSTMPDVVPISSTPHVKLTKVSVKWLKTLTECNLVNINFQVDANELVAVVGPVGAGKSTLLSAILKELKPVKGTIDVTGSVSYACQEPWVFGSTIRQNILFGSNYIESRYKEVVRVCALERDLHLLPHGDNTLVGEFGAGLSGGQRARINLARAIYKKADIYLLDDPLSAVDAKVSKEIFEECICGFLGGKCVVLVTHQLQYLRQVNKIYLMENGRIKSSGNYNELKQIDGEFTRIIANAEEMEKVAEENRRRSTLKDEEMKKELEQPQLEKEAKFSGVVPLRVYMKFLRAWGNWCKIITIIGSFILAQLLVTGTDYFLTFWVNYNQMKLQGNDSLVDWSFLFDTPATTLAIYSSLVVLLVVVVLLRSLTFFLSCIKASAKLHDTMFGKIVFSPMKFFLDNPTGRILNRFSKDIGSIDEILPVNFIDTIQVGLMVLSVTVIIGYLNPWILIPTVVIGVIFYFIRKVYLSSSRDIKRIEGIKRSPMYTHLTATLQGLGTIRAFGAQEILTEEFDKYQDQYTSVFYLFLCAMRTFGFWLDFHSVIYIGLVIVSILFIEKESFGGNVGLALTQSMTLTYMFQYGMRQWSELENQMTSVERVQEYADLTPEKDENIIKPPDGWPSEGKIEFKNVSMRYSPEKPPILKHLNFVINPTEKIGIVGRTGAGKSSLIQALFRLADIEGAIYIDGVDTQSIARKNLRFQISIIPQEPVLFSSTLRKNLDPFDECDDETLWNALEQVELKATVKDLPLGLNSKVAEGGSNFSVGQRQLVCLARAIVRNTKILVLDEATANVDPHTDSLIQKTIKTKFEDCTVLTIAHRLITIMDSDKVLVMDSGEAREFNHSYRLLKNEGIFVDMVRQTGKASEETLKDIAKDSYKRIYRKLTVSSVA